MLKIYLDNTEIKIDGTKALLNTLGEVEAERYISLIKREPFDFTRWQRDLWKEKAVEEISQAAMELRNTEG
jgi:hypothetical protein